MQNTAAVITTNRLAERVSVVHKDTRYLAASPKGDRTPADMGRPTRMCWCMR